MLYIINKDYFLIEYLLDALKDKKDISIIQHKRSENRCTKGITAKIRKWHEAFYTSETTTRFFDVDYLSQLSRITPNDQVLFFGVENLKDLLILRKFINTGDISAFLWNPVSAINHNLYSQYSYSHYLHKYHFKVYTFDPQDAKRFHLNVTNQVYRSESKIETPLARSASPVDLFFIGKDKHRAKILLEIKQLAESQGIISHFYIQKDKHTKIYPGLASCMQSQPISYPETLEYVRKSKCLLEIQQKGQSGYTLRTLESLFFQKKLLTNNKNIRQSIFYHPDNIFIWGENAKDSLADFLQRPLHVWPLDLLTPYEIRTWIQQFERPILI